MFSIIFSIALAAVLVVWGFVLFTLIAAARGGKAALRALRRQVRNQQHTDPQDPHLAIADQWLDLSQ
jgi:hypothetical protein